MAFHIRDRETDRLVRELAQQRGIGLTEAVKEAVSESLAKQTELETQRVEELRAKLAPLWERVDAMPKTGFVPDKAFYDDLWDEVGDAK